MTLLDEFTREFLTIHVAWSIRAEDVITVVEVAMARYGKPAHIRSDNGPEFIAYAIQDWLEKNKIEDALHPAGMPWENGHIESFHDKLRDECLNRELFGSLLEAKVLVEQWRIDYNTSGLTVPWGTKPRRSSPPAGRLRFGLRPALRLPAERKETSTTGRTTLLMCPTSGVRSIALSLRIFGAGKTVGPAEAVPVVDVKGNGRCPSRVLVHSSDCFHASAGGQELTSFRGVEFDERSRRATTLEDHILRQ